jgi:hypothetical protein
MAEQDQDGSATPRARRSKNAAARSTRPRRRSAQGAVTDAVQETGAVAADALGAIRREIANRPAGLLATGMLVSFVLGYFVGAHRRELAGLPRR